MTARIGMAYCLLTARSNSSMQFETEHKAYLRVYAADIYNSTQLFFFYWRCNPLWVFCILQPSSGL